MKSWNINQQHKKWYVPSKISEPFRPCEIWEGYCDIAPAELRPCQCRGAEDQIEYTEIIGFEPLRDSWHFPSSRRYSRGRTVSESLPLAISIDSWVETESVIRAMTQKEKRYLKHDEGIGWKEVKVEIHCEFLSHGCKKLQINWWQRIVWTILLRAHDVVWTFCALRPTLINGKHNLVKRTRREKRVCEGMGVIKTVERRKNKDQTFSLKSHTVQKRIPTQVETLNTRNAIYLFDCVPKATCTIYCIDSDRN